MNHLKLFEYTVNFYKSSPDLFNYSNGTLSLSESQKLILSDEQVALLEYIFEFRNLFRSFYLEIDWDDAKKEKIVPNASCTSLQIEFELYSGNEFCFYDNEHHLFSNLSSSLIKGKNLPKSFFLIDEDYKSNSDLTLKAVTKFNEIIKWINFLTQTSNLDKKTDDGLILYFLIKGENDKFAKPLEIEINNLQELVNLEEISPIDDISMLISKDDHGNLHHQDRQSFFKLALVDTLRKVITSNTKDTLTPRILFENLDKIKSSYYEHYEVFIHNFAIGEFQQQVEEKGFEYAEKVSSVLNDIQIRLYAIPIVLVSLGALAKVDDIYSYTFVISGVLITGLFNSWMINDQVLRLEQIEKSSKFAFNRLKDECEEKLETQSVLNNLTDIVNNIENRIADRNTKIRYYKILCWLPTLIAAVLLLLKERAAIFNFFNLNFINTSASLNDFLCVFSSLSKVVYFFL